jgi:hypothetical protein
VGLILLERGGLSLLTVFYFDNTLVYFDFVPDFYPDFSLNFELSFDSLRFLDLLLSERFDDLELIDFLDSLAEGSVSEELEDDDYGYGAAGCVTGAG